MPVDSKVGRRHWGWLILLVTFRKFQHFNLVSKIFQKLFKPLPCHKSIGKMLHAICISAVAVSLRWASCGPWASCFFFVALTLWLNLCKIVQLCVCICVCRKDNRCYMQSKPSKTAWNPCRADGTYICELFRIHSLSILWILNRKSPDHVAYSCSSFCVCCFPMQQSFHIHFNEIFRQTGQQTIQT